MGNSSPAPACRRSCSAPPTPSSGTCGEGWRWRRSSPAAASAPSAASSIATAATFAKVAYPSMKRYGYSDALATGAIAAGGTLGILIPPSTIMVIYGIMTGTNIGKLFAAGILPGVLAVFLLCLAVQYVTWRDPKRPARRAPELARAVCDAGRRRLVCRACHGAARRGATRVAGRRRCRRDRRLRGIRPVARLTRA